MCVHRAPIRPTEQFSQLVLTKAQQLLRWAIDMGRKVGDAIPFVGELGPQSTVQATVL